MVGNAHLALDNCPPSIMSVRKSALLLRYCSFSPEKELNYLKKVPFVLKKCPLGRKCAALLRKSALLLENSALLLESSALLPEKIAFSRLLPPNLILPTAALLELNELFL